MLPNDLTLYIFILCNFFLSHGLQVKTSKNTGLFVKYINTPSCFLEGGSFSFQSTVSALAVFVPAYLRSDLEASLKSWVPSPGAFSICPVLGLPRRPAVESLDSLWCRNFLPRNKTEIWPETANVKWKWVPRTTAGTTAKLVASKWEFGTRLLFHPAGECFSLHSSRVWVQAAIFVSCLSVLTI